MYLKDFVRLSNINWTSQTNHVHGVRIITEDQIDQLQHTTHLWLIYTFLGRDGLPYNIKTCGSSDEDS